MQSTITDRKSIRERAHRLRVLHFEKRIPQEAVAGRLKGGGGVTRQYYNAVLNGREEVATDALLSEAEAVLRQIVEERGEAA